MFLIKKNFFTTKSFYWLFCEHVRFCEILELSCLGPRISDFSAELRCLPAAAEKQPLSNATNPKPPDMPWTCRMLKWRWRSTGPRSCVSVTISASSHLFIFFNIFYWLCYYSCPISPLYSPLPCTSLPTRISPLQLMSMVVHVNSLASTFPIFFSTSPCLFCTYQLCFLFPS